MANWLYNSLLKQWAEDNRITYRREKEMTKTMEKMVGRIYEELSKWCAERGVVYEYNFSTDDGESCTFITPDTTLTVNHVEGRDPEQFSKYVKSVLFGVDEPVDRKSLYSYIEELEKENIGLKYQLDMKRTEIEDKDAYIGRLEKEDIEKAKDIVYLEDELKKLRKELEKKDEDIKELVGDHLDNTHLRVRIDNLEDELNEKDKNLNTAADKIVQLTCANTSLKGQIDGLRLQLKAEREGYGELKDQYDDKCKAFINMCKHYDSAINKCNKAEEELEKLKAGRHDDTVDVARYLIILGKKKRAEEMIRSLKSQVEICKDVVKNLADQNEAFKKQVDALVKEKLKILAEDDATMDILKKKNATLQYKIDALENDVKSLTFSYKKELEEKEKENLELDNHVKNLVAQNEILEQEKSELQLNVEEFIKNDTLTDIKERIAWILTHMNNAETEADKRFKKLEDGTLFTNDMLTGICARLDKIEKPSEIELNLREVKKDIKEKQDIIDALNSLDQRIAWMEDHMGSNENDVARSIEKIGEELRRVDNELIHAFNRINKLEDAQPKKASKTSKKTQKSTLS